tara:strand:+ start:748 stop:2379 length:1632 start_codon:yes stop_codon:yes gene_type:complete
MKRIIINHVLIFSLALAVNIFILEIFIQNFPQNRMIPGFLNKLVPGITTIKFGLKNSLRRNIDREAFNFFGQKIRIITNEKHIRRATAIDYVKSENIFRILILGDSTTFGQGVRNDQTFSFYLEKILNKADVGMKFEVLNGGVPNWGLIEYYFFLKSEGYKYNPDLIILALDSSDAENLKTHLIHFDRLYTKQTRKGSQTYLEEPKIIPIKILYLEFLISKIVNNGLYDFLTSHFHMINLFRWRFKQILDSISLSEANDDISNSLPLDDNHPNKWIIKENGTEKRVSGVFKSKYVGTKIIIEKMQSFAESRGFNFLTFQLPYHFRVLDQSFSSVDLKSLIPHTYIFSPLQKFRLFQNKFLIPLFMPGDVHMIPSGHKLTAYILYNYLLTSGKFDFHLTKEITPFTHNQIYEAIMQSEATTINLAKSYPFWEFTKAMVYKNKNQLKNSKSAFLRYLELEPDNLQGLFQLSMLLIKEGNFNQAIPHLEKLVEAKGIFLEEARNMLAIYYLKQGDIKTAEFYKNSNPANKNFKNILKKQLGFAFGN